MAARFSVPSRPALVPTQPPIQWVPGLYRGLRRSECGADYLHPSSAGRANSFELQFSLPSVPVHACHLVTFTLTLYKNIDLVLQREHIGASVEILAS